MKNMNLNINDCIYAQAHLEDKIDIRDSIID